MSHRSRNRRAQKRQQFVETETRKRSIKPGTLIAGLGVVIVGVVPENSVRLEINKIRGDFVTLLHG